MLQVLFFLALVNAADFHSVIQRSGISKDHLGISIEGPGINFELNADKKWVPASLSKIITAGAALSELGLAHRFETKIFMLGALDEGVLKGDLYLQGGGDPSLVSESYWAMINELKRSGIKEVQGKLYVDDSLYSTERFSESRQDKRVDRAYDAPVGALSFNWNSVNVYARARGGEVVLFADPANDYVQVVNKARLGKSTDLRVERIESGGKNKIVVSGTVSKDGAESVVYKSVTEPEMWAGYNFKAFLNQLGVRCHCEVMMRKVPANAKQLVSFQSKPLKDIIADMNKFSNNYVAEMLAIALAEDQPKSLKNGMQRIQKWLLKKGWKSENFDFINPSGFTVENLVRPQDLKDLLSQLQKDFTIGFEFVSSLPIAGIDGTLKRRLQNRTSHVRAKTGLLNGKIGLAGYTDKNNQIYSFAFIFNGPDSQEAKARALFDDLLQAL